jgi:hypothetical protein
LRISFPVRIGIALLSGVLAAGALAAPAAAADVTTVAGTLTDPFDQPLAYTSVTVQNTDGVVMYTYTDHTGFYSVDVLPGSYRVSFDATSGTQWAHQRITAAEASVFTVADGETVRVDDRLLAPGSLSGRLTKTDGTTALQGSSVTLHRGDETLANSYTDEEGRYSFAEVLPGEYRLAFQWNDTVNYVPGTVTVVSGEATVADGVLPPETTLVVKAVDSITGAPAGPFCVQVWSLDEPVCGDAENPATITGVSGTERFSVEPDESGFYIAKRGESVTLAANQTTTVSVPLVLGGKVAVTATDRATGQAVGNTCFSLRAIGRPENHSGGCTGADGTGSAESPVPAGTYEAFVMAPGSYGHQWLGKTGGTGDQKAAARIVIKPGKVAKAPVALLDQAGSITGVVTGTDGTPLHRIGVHYQANANYAAGDPGGVRTDATGRYTVGKLGPYEWPLLFSLSSEYPYQWSGNVGNRFQAVKIPVTAGGSSTYDIQLAKGSTLRGGVAPAGSAEVRLLAHNAATGDLVGVFHDYDPQNGVSAYQISLIGGQNVKLQWSLFQNSDAGSWYSGATDISAATKIGVPRSGVKNFDLTHS